MTHKVILTTPEKRNREIIQKRKHELIVEKLAARSRERQMRAGRTGASLDRTPQALSAIPTFRTKGASSWWPPMDKKILGGLKETRSAQHEGVHYTTLLSGSRLDEGIIMFLAEKNEGGRMLAKGMFTVNERTGVIKPAQ